VITDALRIEFVERPLPVLGADEVRLRVSQCGVCASEVDVWTGTAPDELPAAIGHEVAGIVEETGRGVTTLAVGDHVAAWVEGGGFAEQVVVGERFCAPVRADLTFPAVAEPLGCIVNAVELADPALADHVVIIGAGFMGNLLQLVSVLRGPATITVADVRDDALARAAELGATNVVNSGAQSLETAVADVTDGRGADVVYEATGVGGGLELAGRVARMGGKLAIVGYHQGGPREVDIGRWNWMALEIVNAHFRDAETILTGFRAGMRLVNAGVLDVAPLLTHTYPLSATVEAFETATAKPDGFVKAAVEPAT
jgi:L-iditol 2-dehydrogenase